MRKSIAIVPDDAKLQELERLTQSRTTSLRLPERSGIVLPAADGLQAKQIDQQMGIPWQKAASWRKVFLNWDGKMGQRSWFDMKTCNLNNYSSNSDARDAENNCAARERSGGAKYDDTRTRH